MDVSAVISILLPIGLVAAGAVIAYYKASAALQESAAELINEAEAMYIDVTKAGGQRFEWVVDRLYELIPAVARPFLTREKVGAIVQTTFDFIQEFARKQLDKAISTTE